jgi:hypothetical protein
MKRLVNSLLVLVIVIAALAVIISVAASAGQRLSDQDLLSVRFNPQGIDNTILYVIQTGTGNCASWVEACDLQTALTNTVSGDEIWVAAGIHFPDKGTDQSDNDPSSTFQLRADVAIYGGFAGNETTLDQRDWNQNVTVLSGDLEDDDATDANGVITDTANISGTNAFHVVTGLGLTETAVLDGFTITGGNANGDYPDYDGGGMHNQDGNPTLIRIIFSGSLADSHGGGMYTDNGSPTLTGVAFNANLAFDGGGGI